MPFELQLDSSFQSLAKLESKVRGYRFEIKISTLKLGLKYNKGAKLCALKHLV